ncbi:MAG: ATP-binding protein [Chitinophagales bacterium]|nr:ATP-binding protein [Chitinophagales bacterium]
MLRILSLGLLLLIGTAAFTQKSQQKVDSLHNLFVNASGEEKLEFIEPLFHVISVNTSKPVQPILYEMEQLSIQHKKDKELMLSWLMLGWAYQSQFKFDSLRAISHKGIELAKQTKNDTLLAKFYNSVGVSHEKIGVLDSAEYFYKLALATDSRVTMSVYNNLGLAYIRKSNYGKAIEYLELALKEAQEKGLVNAEAVISNNIGISHNKLNNPKKAEAYALRALELKEQLGDERGKLFPMVQLTTADLPLEEHKKYVEAALVQAQKVGDPIFMRLFTAKAAEVLDMEGKYSEALDLLVPVYEQSRKAQSYDQGEVMRVLAYIYYHLKQYDKAHQVATQLMELATSKNALDEIQNARILLMQIYREQGQYQQALQMGTDYYEARDSLVLKLNLDKLAALDEKLEDVERQKQIDFLNSELKQKDIRRKWMIAVGVLLALILSLVIYFRNRRIRAQKAMIAREKETARQLEVMNEKLKGLDQMKNRLFTNITHEFRTPLTVMLGMAEQLESSAENTNEKSQRKLALIRRNGRSLLNLVNQMLDLSKIEDNKLKVDLIQSDIVAYIRYLTESFHSMANAQNVILQTSTDEKEIIMDYDPEKIRQILSNLLSNALKYTPSGGRVMVKIAASEDKKHLVLAVRDTGAGIPKEDLPNIFDRFYQADDTIAKAGGTGIGLALTKELIKLLDGDIRVESELEKGTTFIMQLPITQSAELLDQEVEHFAQAPLVIPTMIETKLESNKTPSSSKQPTLLIVEDNPDVVEYLTDCLESEYQLIHAYNGRIGIEKALELVPDIIISDVMMPEKNGFELCDALKNDERTSHIPIILLTARADVESRISGLKRGADAYLAKPFHREELLAVLAQLVELRSKLRARYAQLPMEAPGTPSPVSQEPEYSMEDAFLKKASALIHDNIANPTFAVQEFCKALGMSYPVVYRKLSALTGRSPALYIREIRLNHAKGLLQSTDFTVSEIAYDCGFNDPKFFSRVFSKEFGQSPSVFRSSLQK